jgi:uncharacterized protein YndB with AHSA1/START domain
MRMESSVVVNRPIDEVWAFATNPFNFPRAGGFLGLRQTSPGPMALGSTLQGRAVFLGFERRITCTVTEFDPPHALAFAFSVAGMGMRSYSMRGTLEATTDGTRMSRVAEFEPRPALKPLWWMILLLYLRRSSKARDQEIKRLIEAEHPSGS